MLTAVELLRAPTVRGVAAALCSLGLVLSSGVWGQSGTAYRHAGVPAPSAEDLAIVKAEWHTDLSRRGIPCNARYEAPDYQYQACLRVFLAQQPPLDRARREHFGEQYDPAKYYSCRLATIVNDTRCERLLLRRRESVEVWPYHVGQPAPIKWPEAPKESVYRPGMSPLEYWRALCKAEGGEFIYKTVPKVTAIYQIRPRAKESELAYRDRYVMEDPYGYIESESGTLDNLPWMVVGPERASKQVAGYYRVLETPVLENDLPQVRHQFFPQSLFQPVPPDKPYQRFAGYDKRDRKTMQLTYVSQLDSRYGWTWRGIRRPQDREVGVAGGELAVVDLKTGEILALRRGFALGALEAGKPVNWFHGNVCPEYHLMPGVGKVRGRNKDVDFSRWFIAKVLSPIVEFTD